MTPDELAAYLLRSLQDDSWDDTAEEVAAVLSALAREAATGALEGVRAELGDPINDLLQQANERAVEWASQYAAELVTQVDEVTRQGLRDLATHAIAEGFTNDQLAAAIEESSLFSPERALLIARTESTNAENQGTLEGWKQSGVVEGKAWAPDANACEICMGNADDGVIALDDSFSSGDDAPGAHPNCECTLEAEIAELAEAA